MKKLIVVSMVLAVAGVASANLLTNGDFDTPFTSDYGGNFTGADGSWAYTGQLANNLPGWSGSDNWGYVRNWTGTGGNDIFGGSIGITSSPQGGGAAGAAGRNGHMLNAWQNTGQQGTVANDTVTLTFMVNSLSLDYGANAWMNVNLQFIGDSQVSWNYNATTAPLGVTQDTWTQVTLEVPALSAGQAGKDIQVHVQSAGVWVDDMQLTVIPEPATLGLFGLVGGGMIWVRKRFTI